MTTFHTSPANGKRRKPGYTRYRTGIHPGFLFLLLTLFSVFIACSEPVEPIIEEEELSSECALKTLTFLPEFNKELDAPINARLSGTTFTAVIPYVASPGNLAASFTYIGVSVKVDNIDQTSNVTRNDFSEPVIYTVFAEDSSKKDYTVVITKERPRLPRMNIDTSGLPILDKVNYVRSTFTIEDIDTYYSDQVSFTGTGGIRGRGNSTWGMDKKPYRIKLDEKATLLGMSNDKDWALLANHTDKTLLRNITAFELSRIVGMKWTPGSLSIDLYLNDQYQGVYALTEHVKVSKERLNMDLVKKTDNEGEAVTGGYLLELDFHYDEDWKFKTNLKALPIMFKDPDKPTAAQFEYVKTFFNKAEQALYSPNFKDPETGYRKYIDVESFINYYIVQEVSKNVDGNMRGSCYLALPRNGKIEQPLVWDFDIAFGNADHITWEQGASSTGPDGWYIKECSPWFDQFFKDPYFVNELKKRWNEVKPELDKVPDFIKEHAWVLMDSQAKNFSPKSQGGAGWEISKPEWNTKIVRLTYKAEVDYLIYFVEQRIQWLHTRINAL